MKPLAELKQLLAGRDPGFWSALGTATREARSFEDLFYLARLRAKALKEAAPGREPRAAHLRLALLAGYTTHPLRELLVHVLDVEGIECELFSGEYDNYTSEILELESPLYRFEPNVVVILPSHRRCRYPGKLTDPAEEPRAQADEQVRTLLELCGVVRQRTGADVLLGNFVPPAHFDPGPFRARALGSEWAFRRYVNLELGLRAPREVHICDLDYLAARRGLVASRDDRAWFESKQLGAPDFLVDVARELAHLVVSLRKSPKKVLVLDLDNTLWGGVVGDDGLQGIEIGDTSPRGEAFKAFQHYILSLTERGILLAVCSKNDEEVAKEAFEKHPEMVLRMNHFAGFRANWNPKSDNIRALAEELNLGLDSFVFVDDNPAEIEIVRQFCPQVTNILLGPDPSTYVATLQDARLFEPTQMTKEDALRVEQYRVEADRRALLASSTDMESFLTSLEMIGRVHRLGDEDLPRATQLINKSNQFNLTTVRRSEVEVQALARSARHGCFTVRLEDRFGDHGLISVVLTEARGEDLLIDTWVMSCRVLKRGVEDVVVNEIAAIAREKGSKRVVGTYLPTAKNGMVRGLYPQMGFSLLEEAPDRCSFILDVTTFTERPHHIRIVRRT
jgi:FkbH-like protein